MTNENILIIDDVVELESQKINNNFLTDDEIIGLYDYLQSYNDLDNQEKRLDLSLFIDWIENNRHTQKVINFLNQDENQNNGLAFFFSGYNGQAQQEFIKDIKDQFNINVF
mgnify:FL=1